MRLPLFPFTGLLKLYVKFHNFPCFSLEIVP